MIKIGTRVTLSEKGLANYPNQTKENEQGTVAYATASGWIYVDWDQSTSDTYQEQDLTLLIPIISKGKNERGMDELVGETIKFIDTSAINVVHFHCVSGKVVSVDGEEQRYGIPVISVNKY